MTTLRGPFHLQGHRGARGRKPENTLPSFETALDAGVSGIETDLHLTRDGVAVLCHDPVLSATIFTPPAGATPVAAIADLPFAELRRWRADRNPDAVRFPHQDAVATPLARWFAEHHGIDPFAVPSLSDLFRFAAAYAGEAGERVGKSPHLRVCAARVGFDLEFKGVPFSAPTPRLLERRVVEEVRAAGVADRTTVRAFDHRCVRRLRALEPRLAGAVLVAHLAPAAVAELVRAADARIFCPEYHFLDEELVREARAAGLRVLPWTVNDPEDARRVIEWGVDGLTTDDPDRMAERLRAWGVAVEGNE